MCIEPISKAWKYEQQQKKNKNKGKSNQVDNDLARLLNWFNRRYFPSVLGRKQLTEPEGVSFSKHEQKHQRTLTGRLQKAINELDNEVVSYKPEVNNQ